MQTKLILLTYLAILDNLGEYEPAISAKVEMF